MSFPLRRWRRSPPSRPSQAPIPRRCRRPATGCAPSCPAATGPRCTRHDGATEIPVTHKRNRRSFLAAASAVAIATATRATAQGGGQMTRFDFEGIALGSLPPGVTTALTGSGGPVAWSVLDDATAPAGSKVLAQTSSDKTDYRFPLAIFDQRIAADLDVAV